MNIKLYNLNTRVVINKALKSYKFFLNNLFIIKFNKNIYIFKFIFNIYLI